MSKRSTYLLYGAAFIAVLAVPAFFFFATVTHLDEEPFLIETIETSMAPSGPSFRVYIPQDDVLKVGDRKLSLIEFQGFLTEMPVPKNASPALIYADQDISVEYVMNVQKIVKDAGYETRVTVIRQNEP